MEAQYQTGTFAHWSDENRYGFIRLEPTTTTTTIPASTKDKQVFCHRSQIQDYQPGIIAKGTRVQFLTRTSEKGPQAYQASLLPSLPPKTNNDDTDRHNNNQNNEPNRSNTHSFPSNKAPLKSLKSKPIPEKSAEDEILALLGSQLSTLGMFYSNKTQPVIDNSYS